MITASLVLCAAAAHAEPSEADRLFLEGRELYKAGKLEKACAKFERAHELDKGPGIVANLAECRERFGDPAEAWRLFRDAAARWDNAAGAKLTPASSRSNARSTTSYTTPSAWTRRPSWRPTPRRSAVACARAWLTRTSTESAHCSNCWSTV